MPTIEIQTNISAPPEVCFDFARDLDLHVRGQAHTREHIVGGRAGGLIEAGEEVVWRARHFGFWHEHAARITAFDRPHHFRDEMLRGRFRRFVHDHYFEQAGDGTRMRDVLEFAAPWGVLGRLVDALVLSRYLTSLLRHRGETIRVAAERRG